MLHRLADDGIHPVGIPMGQACPRTGAEVFHFPTLRPTVAIGVGPQVTLFPLLHPFLERPTQVFFVMSRLQVKDRSGRQTIAVVIYLEDLRVRARDEELPVATKRPVDERVVLALQHAVGHLVELIDRPHSPGLLLEIDGQPHDRVPSAGHEHGAGVFGIHGDPRRPDMAAIPFLVEPPVGREAGDPPRRRVRLRHEEAAIGRGRDRAHIKKTLLRGLVVGAVAAAARLTEGRKPFAIGAKPKHLVRGRVEDE